jgi:O-succinylbenzoic acid--CoA ligase
MPDSIQYLVPESLYTPERPAVICGDEVLSYGQLFSAVAMAEDRLMALGIRPGDRAGILSPNTPDYIIILLALWRISAVACPLSTRVPENTLSEQLRSINCRYFFTPSGTSTIADIEHVHLNGIIPAQSDISEEEGENFPYQLDRDATVIFTSGSSSKPKAAMHALASHFYSAKGSNEHLPVVPGDRWLLSLPLYHVGGLGIVLRAFLGGGSVVIPKEKEGLVDALARYEITHVSMVPTQLIRLLRNKDSLSKLKCLKAILLGGGPIPGALIDEALEAGLPVYITYGLTEMASQVATSHRLTRKNKHRAAKVLNYRQLMIDEGGEILVKGETLLKGYIDDGKLVFPFNANSYFATGDLGAFADNGHLVVAGRKDNMFVSGGENIQPEEIEHYLCNIKGIEQAIVVPVPHAEYGLRPVAFIKGNGKGAITSQDILAHLSSRLPKFKIPDQFYAWPVETRNGGLKTDRRELIRRAGQANLPNTPLPSI